MNRFLLISRKVVIALVLLLFGLWLVIQMPAVQHLAGNIIAQRLGKVLDTRVEVDGFQINILNRLSLRGLRVFDKGNDTLLSVGQLKLALSDWFPWQDTIRLYYLSLEDTHLKIQRFDSTWNDAFLDGLFRGDSDTTAGKPLKLSLQIVNVSNLSFQRLDYWRGIYKHGRIGTLEAKGHRFDLDRGQIVMDYARISGPGFSEIRSGGRWSEADSIAFWRRIDSLDAVPKAKKAADPDPFMFSIRSITIDKGDLRFFNRRKNPSTPGVFDERDIIISQITGRVRDFQLKGDTLRGDVQLSCSERSGFRIRSLSTRFTMHPQLMEFADLDLVTNRSRLRNYYAMRYRRFEDMEYFLDKVQLVTRLRDARVSVEDIAVFAPDLRGIIQEGTLSGDARGTVSNFEVEGLDLRAGQSRIAGTYKMKGLIDIDHTLIDFTTGNSLIFIPDLEPWAPALHGLRQTPVANLGVVGFKGRFQGTPFDFYTNGLFETNVGIIDADLKLKLNGTEKGYVSRVRGADVDGGDLLGVPGLGRMLFTGEVSGNGFEATSPVTIAGTLNEINYSGYTYRGLNVKSTFEDYLLTANLAVSDPNLEGNIKTVLNFRDKKQKYKAEGNIVHSNFYNLKLFGDTLLFRGDFDVDFSGNKVDDFLGYARFYNASVSNGRRPLSFDSLLIESRMDASGFKKLSLRTNEAVGNLEGRFDLSKLPASFSLFLSRYYPALIKAPEGEVPGQDFSFEINTRQVEPFLKLFDKQIGGGNFARIFGSLNTETRQLLLSADVPSFQYGSVIFSDIDLQGSGSQSELNIYASAENLRLNEKVSFPKAALKIATIQDSTRLSLNTQSSGPLGNAVLNADFFSQQEGFALEFLESSFIAGKKKWTIEQGSGFQLKNNNLISDGLKLSQDQQQLEAFTRPSKAGNWNDLYINLNQFNMGDWLPYFLTDPSLEGMITGKAVVMNPTDKPVMQADLVVDRFYFNADSVGKVTLNGRYTHSDQVLNALIKSENPGYDFLVDAGLHFSDTAASALNSRMVFRNEKLSVLNRYLSDVFDSIDGYAQGEITVTGPFSKPSIEGALSIRDAEMLVGYTQCLYKVDSATLIFGDNFIDFGQLKFSDSRKRTGRVEGRLFHRFFDSMYFNMRLRTDGMQVLNTLSKDNDLFYGDVTGRVNMQLTGPIKNLMMRISGAPTDSSWMAISSEDSRTSGEADYIVFKEYGTAQEVKVDTSVTNIHMELELTANPLCRVDVVLDELTGDIISARGNGNFSIKSGTVDPTEMRGRFNVQSGSYNYTFQTFIRKPFILDGEGDNFLEWSGDPYEANMKVKATYIAKDVSLRDLVSNEGSTLLLDQNARNYKGDVYVNADISGNLSRPAIRFSIEFPPGSVMRNNITANDLLRRISEDESENLRQVTYLIVFRSFAPFRQGAGARNPGADLAVNTISELVSREMEKILTGVIQDLTRDKSLSVDLSTNFYNSSQTLSNVSAFNQYDRVNFNFNLNRSFFNSRVKLNLGSDFDLNVRNTTATGFQFLPDVSVEFILTANRRLRAIVFKRDNLDISGRRNRAGASISYRKDFDKLFGRREEEALFFIRQRDTSGK